MDKVFLFFAVLASFTILCQWFVFSSVRKYLFKKYAPVTRGTAYPVLLGLGVLNYLGIKLALDTGIFAADSFGRQVMGVLYFNFLGCTLALVLFFLVLGVTSTTLAGLAWTWRKARGTPAGCWTGPLHGETGAMKGREEPDQTGPIPDARERRCTEDALAPTRREFLKWGAATGVAGIIGLAGHGTARGFSAAVIERFDMPHPSLTGLSRPVVLIQVTDLHYGLFFGEDQLEHLVTTLNGMEADAVVITGDVFHSPITPVESAIRPLQKLRERRIGNFVIMGNHDFYAGEWRSTSAFEKAGLNALRNRWVRFEENGSVIHLGGIDDPLVSWITGKTFPDFSRFARTIPQGPGMRVLLSHRPAVLPYAAQEGIDLVLAGHIHGGQIVIPRPGLERGLSVAALVSEYTYGWYRDRKTRMYLNRGVGMTFVPWRIHCPPEIAVLRLTAPSAADLRVAAGEQTE
ncbi:MAG: metallophosphoesterase [Thermodesulfobacteriota bacterium]